MSISTKTRATLHEKLADYEGYIKHIYIDTLGNMTIGVGHLLSTKYSVSGITLYKTQNKALTQPATLQEKMDEYDIIKKLSWGTTITAKSFEKHSTLVMKNSDIDFLTNKHIDSFYTDLKNSYTKEKGYPNNFEKYEYNLQLALFDMIFNLGATKLRNGFPNFHSAFKAHDYKKMAIESHRSGINNDRNNYVRDLILSLVPETEV